MGVEVGNNSIDLALTMFANPLSQRERREVARFSQGLEKEKDWAV